MLLTASCYSEIPNFRNCGSNLIYTTLFVFGTEQRKKFGIGKHSLLTLSFSVSNFLKIIYYVMNVMIKSITLCSGINFYSFCSISFDIFICGKVEAMGCKMSFNC